MTDADAPGMDEDDIDEPYVMEIIARLAEFVPERREREICRAAGVNETWLSNVRLRKSKNPKVGYLKRVCEAAGAPLTYVVSGERPVTPAQRKVIDLLRDDSDAEWIYTFLSRRTGLPDRGNF